MTATTAHHLDLSVRPLTAAIGAEVTGIDLQRAGEAEPRATCCLHRWSVQERFTVRRHWSEGTIAMWDNRCTQHFVVNDFQGERIINRVTVLGDHPEGGCTSLASLPSRQSGDGLSPRRGSRANPPAPGVSP